MVNDKRLHMKFANEALRVVRETLGEEGVYVCGSMRRGKTIVGDLDVVVVTDEAASDLGGRLKDLCGVDMAKRKSVSFVVPVDVEGTIERVQVDLNLCTSEIKGTYLMHWTGSMKENVRLRAVAKSKGMMLSQNGLFDSAKVNRAINCTEEEVYALLGVEYVEPSKR